MLNPQNLPNGNEQYEQYRDRVLKKKMVQYDYRSDDGTLFSCVRKSLEDCRRARDIWLAER